MLSPWSFRVPNRCKPAAKAWHPSERQSYALRQRLRFAGQCLGGLIAAILHELPGLGQLGARHRLRRRLGVGADRLQGGGRRPELFGQLLGLALIGGGQELLVDGDSLQQRLRLLRLAGAHGLFGLAQLFGAVAAGLEGGVIALEPVAEVLALGGRQLLLAGLGLLEKGGRELVVARCDAGDIDELDVTSLSSLTAGNVAATGGISKILREKDFTSQFHEGEKTHVHITLVGGRAILVVLFDERSSLGLVRLRVKKSSDEMVRLFDQVAKKAAAKSQPSILTEITDSDIDNLFND